MKYRSGLFKKILAGFISATFVLSLFTTGTVLADSSNIEQSIMDGSNSYYAESINGQNEQSVAGNVNGEGIIPSPIEIASTGENPEVLSVYDNSLPALYDGREFQTPVKNQESEGACWAFAANAVMEAYLKKTTGMTYDFSERNMLNNHGFNNDYLAGSGNRDMACAYLTRWAGPVLEDDDYPYNPPSSATKGYMPDKVRFHVQGLKYIADRDLNTIKQCVKEYGAVFTCMYYEFSYLNKLTSAYFYNGNNVSANHGVAIVGWDDNYSASNFNTNSRPSSNGAFIVKNSYGTSWGDGGYFYVSYEDAEFGIESFAIDSIESSSNYNHIYQYDPLGWTRMSGYGKSGTDTVWFSSVYSADQGINEKLRAVSFYTRFDNAQYEVYVATNYDTSGFKDLTLVKSGASTKIGYSTVVLDTPIPLTASDKFAVAVKMTTPGHSFAIPIEYNNGWCLASANYGECYYSTDGSNWIDTNTIPEFSNLTSVNSNVSVCLKAFTDDGTVEPNAAKVSFSPNKYIFAENAGQVELKVSRTDSSTRMSVDYVISNCGGLLETLGYDNMEYKGNLTFEEGESEKAIPITIKDDQIEEDVDEVFSVKLTNASSGTYITSGVATVTIVDNDRKPEFSFAKPTYSVNENDGEVELTVNRAQNTLGSTTLHYSISDVSTISGIDYEASSGILSFEDGEDSKTLNIKINDNSLYEGADKIFNVTLSEPSFGEIASGGENATVTIVDNDYPPYFSFGTDSYTVNEGGTVELIVKRTVNTSGRITLQYKTFNSTAMVGSDYEASFGTLTFEDGEDSKIIRVKTIDNNTYAKYPNINFRVEISEPSVEATIDIGTVYVNIVDNDPHPEVSIDPTTCTVNEGDTVELTIKRTGDTSGTSAVYYETVDDSAKVGSDYVKSSNWITFYPGQVTKTIKINTISDATSDEGNENFNVILRATYPTVTKNGGDKATITINELTPTQIEFSPVAYSVSEGTTGTVELTVKRSGDTAIPLSVNYSTADGTAKAQNIDYEEVSNGKINFGIGETTKTITIPIYDDADYELNETFNVVLSNPSSGSITNGTATVTIIDSCPIPEFSFNTTAYTVNEGDIAIITAKRTGGDSRRVTLQYTTKNGSAIAGSDYEASNGTITFEEGENSKTIAVRTIENNTYTKNPNTYFYVMFCDSSSNEFIVSSQSANINIVDNDPHPEVSIDPIPYTVNEGGTVELIIKRTGDTSGTSTVYYSTTDGSAKAENDYVESSGWINFKPGETIKTIYILTKSDVIIDEGNETFNVTLRVIYPTITTIEGSKITITIMDNGSN